MHFYCYFTLNQNMVVQSSKITKLYFILNIIQLPRGLSVNIRKSKRWVYLAKISCAKFSLSDFTKQKYKFEYQFAFPFWSTEMQESWATFSNYNLGCESSRE